MSLPSQNLSVSYLIKTQNGFFIPVLACRSSSGKQAVKCCFNFMAAVTELRGMDVMYAVPLRRTLAYCAYTRLTALFPGLHG